MEQDEKGEVPENHFLAWPLITTPDHRQGKNS
jgi:hypothetical protein